jgi:hypothetical protein
VRGVSMSVIVKSSDPEAGQSATEKEALLLKCNQMYISILFSTAALPTLLQALRTKNNFRSLYVGCVAFQSFSL